MASCRISCEDDQTKLVIYRAAAYDQSADMGGFTQEKEALEAQKRDQWVPKVGSMIFIPRMKGNFKVRHTLLATPAAHQDMQVSCMYATRAEACPLLPGVLSQGSLARQTCSSLIFMSATP